MFDDIVSRIVNQTVGRRVQDDSCGEVEVSRYMVLAGVVGGGERVGGW